MAHLEGNFVEKEMLAAVVEAKMGDAIKLYPLTKVVAVEAGAGATIQIPKVGYIGDAIDVEAGGEIKCSDMTQTIVDAKVKKVAKGVKFTEEDLINAHMDVQGNAEKQILKAIANKVEKDLFAELAKATLTATIATLDVDGLADAIVPFGEDIEEPMFLLVNPADLAVLRKDDNFIVNAGFGEGKIASAGQIFGMEVVVTNAVPAKTAYILKEEAVALYMKKAVKVEDMKDIHTQTYHVLATQHYVAVLNDETKVVKVTIGA